MHRNIEEKYMEGNYTWSGATVHVRMQNHTYAQTHTRVHKS